MSSGGFAMGPGPLTPVIKVIIAVNVAAFLLQFVAPATTLYLGLQPADVLERLRIWQPVTYMFLHGGLFHLLFNMLSLWMFGVELERMWGSPFFARFYAVAGLGAAATTIVLAFLPGAMGQQLYYSLTIGASGAIFGVLLAYGMYFPDRQILFWGIFPIQAKYFVIIMGGISLLSSMGGGGGGVAHWAHLGGLLSGWLYLKGRRVRLGAEIQYQFSKWRINRMRRRFDVHRGGRDDTDRRIH
jgi:membrane associated rhomboid family serine protease